MAISASDILIKLSTTSGAAGDSTAQSTAGANLGKFMASTEMADATLGNLFPDITGDENRVGNVDYQCIFVHNNHATLTYQNAVVWVSAQVSGGASVDIALDSTAISDHDSDSAQALTIADKDTAPSGLTFAGTAVSKATGLAIGDLAPGEVKAVWVKRTAVNSAALDNDGATLSVAGDTAA